MSRIDQHVRMVRNKLALGRLVDALGWTLLGLAAVMFGGVLVARLFSVQVGGAKAWMGAGLVVAGALAAGYAIWRRPGEYEAAVAIDRKLGLKEKFSTALFARRQRDEFARAAVADAEATAQKVSLHKQFPLKFPRISYAAIGVAILAILAANYLKPLDLLGQEKTRLAEAQEEKRAQESKQAVREALVRIEAMPAEVAKNETVRNAKRELEAMLKTPPKNPEQARLTAQKALQDAQEALKQEIAKNQNYANAQQDRKTFASLPPPTDQGSVAQAQRDLANGDFQSAVNHLQQAVNDFDKMDQKEKEKTVQQMKELANQLRQMANNPDAQRQMEQKLQEMGATQEQAQQMAKLMRQAANGDPQAQQQLAQMQQQLMQQMNNGQGPTQQQNQQFQQMMQQLQAQANSQNQAQQLAQNAQQLAQAMQQAQKQGQQGGQNNGQANPQNAQQMAQAQQAMQQQLQQMQAIQNMAQQLAAAQQAANGGNNPNGQGQQQNQGGQNNGPGGQGQWAAGNPNQQGNGNGGPGQGNGPRDKAEVAPGDFKAEHSPSQDQENGKVLASTYVQASSVKGESKEQLHDVAEAAQREQTDEIDQERISRQDQQTVKHYFGSMQEDAK